MHTLLIVCLIIVGVVVHGIMWVITYNYFPYAMLKAFHIFPEKLEIPPMFMGFFWPIALPVCVGSVVGMRIVNFVKWLADSTPEVPTKSESKNVYR